MDDFEESCLQQVHSNAEAIIAHVRLLEGSMCAEVRSIAASKRVKLQEELVAADTALETALSTLDALTEVRVYIQ